MALELHCGKRKYYEAYNRCMESDNKKKERVMDEKSEACQKGGRTTQRIKSLEREVERLKDDLYKTIQLMEFWKYNWTEEYERMYFMPQSRKVE